MPESKFADYHDLVWKNAWNVTLWVQDLTGGFPLNEDVIEGWLKSKIADNDELLRAAIAQNLLDSVETREYTDPKEAAKALAKTKSLKGFKRDIHGLYIEGRQPKAMFKEAAMIAAQGGHIEGGQKYGKLTTKKGLFGFIAEHVMVPEQRVYVCEPMEVEVDGKLTLQAGKPRTMPDEVRFDFVHLSQSHGFKQSEVVHEAMLTFVVETDYDFPKDFFEKVFTIGEMEGIGSDRSQSQGRYKVVGWEKIR